MIQNPHGKLTECAATLRKGPNTISMIVNTDLFRRYLVQRKAEWRERHDQVLANKLHRVAGLSLDILADQLEKKQSAVPLRDVSQIASTTLERLGYGVAPPPTAVQVNVQNNIPSVPLAALTEAREALRKAEERRRSPDAFSNSGEAGAQGPLGAQGGLAPSIGETLDGSPLGDPKGSWLNVSADAPFSPFGSESEPKPRWGLGSDVPDRGPSSADEVPAADGDDLAYGD